MKKPLRCVLVALWPLAITPASAGAALVPSPESPIAASLAEAFPDNLPPAMIDALCVVYPEEAVCSIRGLAAEIMWCALGAFGFIKAAKVGRVIARALRTGDEVGEAIVKGFGAITCAAMVIALIEYTDCLATADTTVNYNLLLADELDRIANHFERKTLPSDWELRPEIEIPR